MLRDFMTKYFFILFVLSFISLNLFAAQTDCPVLLALTYTNGDAVTTQVDYEVHFYSALTGGTEIPPAQTSSATPSGGILVIPLICDSTLLNNPNIFLEFIIGGETLTPRVEMASTPFAGTAFAVAGDSITLGTDTVGSYVESLTAGTGISIVGGTGEGSTPTISVNTGTAAGNLVQLDGSARLPAVDGSQLTNISISNSSVSSASITDGTIQSADIGNDVIDFSNLADSLTLDTATTINTNGNNMVVDLDNAATFSIRNQSPGGFNQLQVYSLGMLGTNGAGESLFSFSATGLSLNLNDIRGSQRLCYIGADGETGYVSVGDCDGAQADLAEHYGSQGNLEAGDIVSLDTGSHQFLNDQHKVSSKAFVKLTSKSYDPHVMGIISSNPFGEILGEGIFDNSEYPVPLALVGRVPVKVSAVNGPISVGDPITTSDIPGFGMKATKSGPIVGLALEEFNGDKGSILIFLKQGWYQISNKQCVNTDGTISLKASFKSVKIYTSFNGVMPNIQITPLSDPEGNYWLSDISADSFTFNSSSISKRDRLFSWMGFCSEK